MFPPCQLRTALSEQNWEQIWGNQEILFSQQWSETNVTPAQDCVFPETLEQILAKNPLQVRTPIKHPKLRDRRMRRGNH